MPVTTRIDEVRKEITALAEAAPTAQDLMKDVCTLLHERMLKYNWISFYLLEPGAKPPVLVLNAFVGAMTPHTRIPLNQGICGAAASSGKTIVVDDVSKDPRYLACSLETKSEIVVPVFVKQQVVGGTGHRQSFSRGVRRRRSGAGAILRRSGGEKAGEALKVEKGTVRAPESNK